MTAPTVSESVLVDSSGWLEFITADTKAELFLPYFSAGNRLLVPTVVLYEVRKTLMLRDAKLVADWFVSEALRHIIVLLDHSIAFEAAALSVQYQLYMADAIIYATAREHGAQIITSDSHFANLPKVTLL